MDALRAHHGPVLLTARLDEVVVMDGGQPSSERTWKVQGHKSLPFDAAAVVQLRDRGSFLLTKAKSAQWPLDRPTEIPGFTVAGFWRKLGLAGAETSARSHAAVRADAPAAEASAPTADAPREAGGAAADAPAAASAPALDEAAWSAAIAGADSVDALRGLFEDARGRGLLGAPFGEQGMMLGHVIQRAAEAMKAASAPVSDAAAAEAAAA